MQTFGNFSVVYAWILEFADGLNLVVCNTLFVKQESQLVTYAAGPVKSKVDFACLGGYNS